MSKIDFKKFGIYCLDAIKSNSGAIAGGLSMIALALLCRKLNVPYSVLTETPIDSQYCFSNHGRDVDRAYDLIPSMLASNNPVQASITAIYEASKNYSFDSQKKEAARSILGILRANKDTLQNPGVYTYAITILQRISNNMMFDSNRKEVTDMIAKIGKGEI